MRVTNAAVDCNHGSIQYHAVQQADVKCLRVRISDASGSERKQMRRDAQQPDVELVCGSICVAHDSHDAASFPVARVSRADAWRCLRASKRGPAKELVLCNRSGLDFVLEFDVCRDFVL